MWDRLSSPLRLCFHVESARAGLLFRSIFMVHSDHCRSGEEIATLMDVASTLTDFTQSSDCCKRIPRFLSDVLNLEAMTMAIVRRPGETVAHLAFQASSGHVISSESVHSFTDSLIRVYQKTRSIFEEDACDMPDREREGASQDSGRLIYEMSIDELAAFPHATVFLRDISESHSVLLIVHQRPGDIHLPAELIDDLLLIAQELSKQLHCLLEWQDSPQPLGYPFKQLTERGVVCASGADIGRVREAVGGTTGIVAAHVAHLHQVDLPEGAGAGASAAAAPVEHGDAADARRHAQQPDEASFGTGTRGFELLSRWVRAGLAKRAAAKRVLEGERCWTLWMQCARRWSKPRSVATCDMRSWRKSRRWEFSGRMRRATCFT